ncbi:HCL002Cp [Eremothecium sinecaudum]|uniref:HCL002Cp n=1 Tax=Eremothecium sinecaudum TaxID=45286 RepID=A0A0X8HRJ9_9SACH|nr:HCL002Cp [Eremothecium sinecaudum]AMD20149.1 HCL002Cp [Eremothecium sinecaudum]
MKNHESKAYRGKIPPTGIDYKLKMRKLGNETSVKTTNPALKKIRKLCGWNELPLWQRDNEHIWHGYVIETKSFKGSLDSLFYLHNESVNIYSHLLPGLCFLFIFIFDKYFVHKFATTSLMDYIMLDIFFLGAFSCLALSSTYHCLKSHSLQVALIGNKLDYLGIVLLISSSMISIYYFGFFDNKSMFYGFSGITLLFGILCAIVSLKSKFRSREWRPYRAGIFVAFGLSAVFPILTGFGYYGIVQTTNRIQLKWILFEALFYIFGAFLYGIRFPEMLAPGSFDIWGHSHQLFHVMVVFGALCHLKALLLCYNFVHSSITFPFL